MIYDIAPETDLYGMFKNELSSPVEYLLYQVQLQEEKPQLNELVNSMSKMNMNFEPEIKSKYNLFKQNEAQSISGSGRQKKFKFFRK